tara:strand:- start:171 stop:437 length:267 start_codon:yes stop_codon:yes gene_type:complete
MLRNAVAEDAIAVSLSIPGLVASATPLQAEAARSAEGEPDDSATYLFELLVAARRLAVTRRHKFLAYLIGMAAEEARLLSQGRSAVKQ